MEVAAARTVPHPLRPTYLTIVRYLARHRYTVDAREASVVTARAPGCAMSALLRTTGCGTRIVLLARGAWTEHHLGGPASYQEARSALYRALGDIAGQIAGYEREYFDRTPRLLN